MEYKGFTLDQFQIDAINALEQNHSVIVSAATGTGKTLIADYLIDKAIREGKKVIYTAPIKALSNQKYRDFKEKYGDKIGLLTGDVSINKESPVLIMTTEIYRNMLVSNSLIDDLKYVIYDEVHYMNDIERGTVWEESIIFSPKFIRFLCLSATIPNADEFADWIRSIKDHPVDVIKYMKRAVPLHHSLYSKVEGEITLDELKEIQAMEESGKRMYGKRDRSFKPKTEKPDHVSLIKYLDEKKYLTAIFFVFSRKQSMNCASDLAKVMNFSSKQDAAKIVQKYDEIIPTSIRSLPSVQQLRVVIAKGIAFHNAGMLPKAKELVELLFAEGLIKVLYATETFAVGINMPARTVCFYSLRKFDGRTFRYISAQEYQQLAGRAGRRGIDEVGYVFSLVDTRLDKAGRMQEIYKTIPEPIGTQFQLSVNVALNLINNYENDEQIETLLKSSFDYYLKRKEKGQIRIMATFHNMAKKLERLEYITKRKLTKKGAFASRIYSNELLITELWEEGLFEKLDPIEIILILSSIAYERRETDEFKINKSYKLKTPKNEIINKEMDFNNLRKLYYVVYSWVHEGKFTDLSRYTNLPEGDIIRLFRQIIDKLKQIKQAAIYVGADEFFTNKMDHCVNLIDKDIVQVEF